MLTVIDKDGSVVDRWTSVAEEAHVIKRCRTDFADIQNKNECGGNRQWQRRFLRNWAANMNGKEIT